VFTAHVHWCQKRQSWTQVVYTGLNRLSLGSDYYDKPSNTSGKVAVNAQWPSRTTMVGRNSAQSQRHHGQLSDWHQPHCGVKLAWHWFDNNAVIWLTAVLMKALVKWCEFSLNNESHLDVKCTITVLWMTVGQLSVPVCTCVLCVWQWQEVCSGGYSNNDTRHYNWLQT